MSDSATLSMISITINGEPHRVSAGLSVAGLVAELGLNPKKVAVERNLEIVPRSTHGDVMIVEGDQLEIVHFVGGG
ncbi:sulfur carrier protein ThiS [uncultured Sphingorhabdus sp.]|uniref:sulfur carrier protein ThiS n=1 Tax=uncultured Sphingorhabdus sp. TaxID=1686106 RepID=UPI00260F8F95|nr:sulfur carrier protein ThiS [uncultured Sphingorhabdus sp.]HMS20386.1 sulfur carrier protein ThiS [Sphingorhabdus sp.]